MTSPMTTHPIPKIVVTLSIRNVTDPDGAAPVGSRTEDGRGGSESLGDPPDLTAGSVGGASFLPHPQGIVWLRSP